MEKCCNDYIPFLLDSSAHLRWVPFDWTAVINARQIMVDNCRLDVGTNNIFVYLINSNDNKRKSCFSMTDRIFENFFSPIFMLFTKFSACRDFFGLRKYSAGYKSFWKCSVIAHYYLRVFFDPTFLRVIVNSLGIVNLLSFFLSHTFHRFSRLKLNSGEMNEIESVLRSS